MSKPAEKAVEVTACLVCRADGWRIQFLFDDGQVAEQNEPPFATQEAAQAALSEWCDENALNVKTAQ